MSTKSTKSGYRMTVAKYQPHRPESCDQCVGNALKFDPTNVDRYLADRKSYGHGPAQVLLCNLFTPGLGTDQFTLCYTHQLTHGVTGVTVTVDTVAEVQSYIVNHDWTDDWDSFRDIVSALQSYLATAPAGDESEGV